MTSAKAGVRARLELHLEQDGGGEAERDGGEELIGDAEDRPERFDSAIGIAHAHDEKKAPAATMSALASTPAPSASRIAEARPEFPSASWSR